MNSLLRWQQYHVLNKKHRKWDGITRCGNRRLEQKELGTRRADFSQQSPKSTLRQVVLRLSDYEGLLIVFIEYYWGMFECDWYLRESADAEQLTCRKCLSVTVFPIINDSSCVYVHFGSLSSNRQQAFIIRLFIKAKSQPNTIYM